MAQSQFRARRKVSGKKYIPSRKKRLNELAGLPVRTLLGPRKAKMKRVRGGNTKKALLQTDYVIVNNKGKCEKLKIESVLNNPANIHYTRRSIITKGGIVKTEKGEVKITSRPGQNAALFGVFLK